MLSATTQQLNSIAAICIFMVKQLADEKSNSHKKLSRN